ncbi:MAG: hypothetical protein SFT92_09835 [Rickettsiales bacterium]|nr:hypothetical protein [Rickettsiales bacterium]
MNSDALPVNIDTAIVHARQKIIALMKEKIHSQGATSEQQDDDILLPLVQTLGGSIARERHNYWVQALYDIEEQQFFEEHPDVRDNLRQKVRETLETLNQALEKSSPTDADIDTQMSAYFMIAQAALAHGAQEAIEQNSVLTDETRGILGRLRQATDKKAIETALNKAFNANSTYDTYISQLINNEFTPQEKGLFRKTLSTLHDNVYANFYLAISYSTTESLLEKHNVRSTELNIDIIASMLTDLIESGKVPSTNDLPKAVADLFIESNSRFLTKIQEVEKKIPEILAKAPDEDRRKAAKKHIDEYIHEMQGKIAERELALDSFTLALGIQAQANTLYYRGMQSLQVAQGKG